MKTRKSIAGVLGKMSAFQEVMIAFVDDSKGILSALA